MDERFLHLLHRYEILLVCHRNDSKPQPCYTAAVRLRARDGSVHVSVAEGEGVEAAARAAYAMVLLKGM